MDLNVYTRAWKRLYGQAIRFDRVDHSSAEDLVQETFLATLLAEPQFSPERGKVHQRMVTRLRNLTRERQISLRERTKRLITYGVRNISHTRKYTPPLERREDFIRSAIVIEVLPNKYREVAHAMDYKRLNPKITFKEIAGFLGIPISTLYTRRKKLRTILEYASNNQP